jgi:ribosomal protein S18 acetylase RimI-like enzyme
MVTIRCGRVDDLPAVVDLWNRAAGPTRHAGQEAEARALLGHDPEALLVAEQDGQIRGTLIVGWDGWRCHLYRMAVDPAARRSGMAGLLLAEARARATGLGAVRIDAMVAVDNDGAVAFWESAGFAFDAQEGRWSLLT